MMTLHSTVLILALIAALSACNLSASNSESDDLTPIPSTLTLEAPTLEPPTLEAPPTLDQAVPCAVDGFGDGVTVSVEPATVLGMSPPCYQIEAGSTVTLSIDAETLIYMPVQVEWWFLRPGGDPDVIGVVDGYPEALTYVWESYAFPFEGQLYAFIFSDDGGSITTDPIAVIGAE